MQVKLLGLHVLALWCGVFASVPTLMLALSRRWSTFSRFSTMPLLLPYGRMWWWLFRHPPLPVGQKGHLEEVAALLVH